MDIASAVKVAEYLGDQKNVLLLEQLKVASQAQSFYVPFMGQFSTGKSCLINSLLGSPVLPVGVLETTSALTKIAGGDKQASYLTLNGERHEITMEDLKRIRQNCDDFDFESIKEIDIHITNDLLNHGLILVDTPGLNTIIKRHEEFAYEILPAAGAIVYVMDKFLTEKDWTILQDLLSRDIPLAFVRTQIDKIAEDSESVTEVIKEDRQQMNKYLGEAENIRYFAVSAKYPEITPDDTSCDWEALRNYLTHEIGDNITAIRDETVKRRLRKITAELSAGLTEKRRNLETQNELDKNDLQHKRMALEAALAALEHSREKQKYRVREQLGEVKQRAKERLDKLTESSIARCQNRLESITDREDLYQKGKGILRDEGQTFTVRASGVLSDVLAEAAADLPQKYAVEVQGILQGSDMEAMFSSSSVTYEDADAIREQVEARLQDEHDELASLMTQEQQKAANIHSLENQWQESVDTLQEAQYETQRARDTLENSTYTPEMVLVPGSTKGSEIGRKIGNALEFVLDVAMLLGSAGTSAAGKAAGEVAAKTTAKAAAKKTLKETFIKTAKDVGEAALKAKAAGNLTGKRKGLWKALDYISPGYWGERLGSNFDEPPHEEEDPIVRAEYEREKRALEQKYVQVRRQQLQREEHAGLLKNSLERERRERELLQRQTAELDKRLREKHQRLQKDFIERDRLNYCQKLQEDYREALKQLAENLLCHWNKYLMASLPIIVVAELKQIEEKIRQNAEDCQKILASGENRAAQFQQMLEEQAKFAKMLEDD